MYSTDISSSFDATVDGWIVVDLTQAPGPYTTPIRTFPAVFDASSGNSGGCIRYTDVFSDIYCFEAPAKFLGDRSASYGQAFEFDILRQPGLFNQDADVILVGAGMTLVIDAGPGPTPDVWTHYAVTLSERGGWRKDSLTGAAPTETEFRALLQSLSAIRIRGDHTNGVETGSLDNVVMRAPATTIGVANVYIARAVEIGWPSEAGLLYQVQWTDNLVTPAWLNLGGTVRGNGAIKTVCDPIGGIERRFYRVLNLQ